MIETFNDNINAQESLDSIIISFTGIEVETIPAVVGARSALLQFYTDAAGIALIGSNPLAVIDETGVAVHAGYTGVRGFILQDMSFYAVNGVKNLSRAKFMAFAAGYTVYCKVTYFKAAKTTVPNATNTSVVATSANQVLEIAKLTAILAKIIAAPATEAKQDTAIASLAAILAKLIAAPSTEAKQDTLIAKDFATQTTLALVLAKLIAAPATEAKQNTLIAKDFATQTTLALVLAKLVAAPATEAKQDTGNVQLGLISARLYQQVGMEVVGFAEGINTDVPADVIAAQGVGYYTYITSILVINSHATVGTLIRIIDGTTAILYKGYAAPVGGGFTISFPTPIRTSVANTKVQIFCGTTGANIVCSISGFKAQ